MLMKVFAVYDLKACAYQQPFFSINSGSAMRAFGDVLTKEPGSVLAMHPEDFQLFELGVFDDNVGAIVGLERLKLLTTLSDFVAEKVSANYVKPAGSRGLVPAAGVPSENGSKGEC